jgi:hypothetical protein
MPSMRELFKSEVSAGGLLGTKGLYGKSKLYIESQGAINPPRLKALLLSSPNALADFISITAAAALGVRITSANRPGDTIFRSPFFLQRAFVGLAGPLAERNTGIINRYRDYYIKQTPAPYQVINQIKSGISTNPIGTLLTAARNELRDGTIRDIFRKRKYITDKYGSKYQHLGTRSKPLDQDVKFSDRNPKYDFEGSFAPLLKLAKAFKLDVPYSKQFSQTAITERVNSRPGIWYSKWDQINNKIIQGSYGRIKQLEIENKKVNVPYVAFEIYGTKKQIILPGTISGLQEDIEPSWNTYKYVGSPFNTYRYSGVERSVKFDLKLYANGEASLENLKKNLDRLRKTVFPQDYPISEVDVSGKKFISGYNPNLLFLTISGYYKRLFGFIDGLNISVDDDIPWATTSESFDGVDAPPHPVVISVSISMKVIEVVDVADVFQTIPLPFGGEVNVPVGTGIVYNFNEVSEESLPTIPK